MTLASKYSIFDVFISTKLYPQFSQFLLNDIQSSTLNYKLKQIYTSAEYFYLYTCYDIILNKKITVKIY